MRAGVTDIDRLPLTAMQQDRPWKKRFWGQYGKTKQSSSPDQGNQEDEGGQPKPTRWEFCRGLSLVTLDSGKAHANCGFEEDTLWYKADKAYKGVAVVKLSLNLNHRAEEGFSSVECLITFSQDPTHHFHSVHRCVPSTSNGVSNQQQVRKGGGLNPTFEGAGFGASAGELHKEKETTRQSTWVFNSQSRPSGTAAGTGAMNDTLVLDWTAPCKNDRVSFAGRKLYAATLLDCSRGDLILNTTLTAKRSRDMPQLPGLPHASRRKPVISSIVVPMTTGTSDNNLYRHGIDAKSWADGWNEDAVPTGNLEIRPDEHGYLLTLNHAEMPNSRPQRRDYPRDDKSTSDDNHPETTDSRPSDDRMQPIGHVYHDRASPSGKSEHPRSIDDTSAESCCRYEGFVRFIDIRKRKREYCPRLMKSSLFDGCLSARIETSQTMTGILHDMVNRNKH